MNLPLREALLDIDWLTRTHAAGGFEALLRYVRNGAEAYGGPVTAMAEALLSLRRWGGLRCSLDAADVRHGLAHALATGSWSIDPDDPRMRRSCGQWIWPALFPPEKCVEFLAMDTACEPPSLPDFHGLRLLGPLDCAWVGHTDGVWGCEVSPDGRHMVSASRDGDVAVWDMELGTLIARGQTGEAEVRDCAVTPDGGRVISVHASGRVTIWDLRTMAVLGTVDVPLRKPTGGMDATPDPPKRGGSPRRWRRFALSADGNRLALAGWDVIDVWDLERFELVTTLRVKPGEPPGMLALFFRSDTTLVTIGRSKPVPVLTWDLRSQRVVARATLSMAHAEYFQRATVTSDHRFLIASGAGETIVWRLDTSALVANVPYEASGQALAVSFDGTLAATSGPETPDAQMTVLSHEVLRLWSLPDLREIECWKLQDFGCRDVSCALAFAPDGQRLVVAGWEGVLRSVLLPAS
jgi:WD40 repeat protein